MNSMKRPGGFAQIATGFVAKRGRLVLAVARNLCDVAGLYRPGGDVEIVSVETGLPVPEREILFYAPRATDH